jgi:transposase-like protein
MSAENGRMETGRAPAKKPGTKKAAAKKIPKRAERRSYPKELKQQVLAMVKAGSKMTDVSRQHGVSYMTLVGWVDAARKAAGGLAKPVSDGGGPLSIVYKGSTVTISTGRDTVTLTGGAIDVLRRALA